MFMSKTMSNVILKDTLDYIKMQVKPFNWLLSLLIGCLALKSTQIFEQGFGRL